MNFIAVSLALRVDQDLADIHILNIVDMPIHDQDRLGSFSWCREVVLTGQFLVCFSKSSRNILAIVLPRQILFI